MSFTSAAPPQGFSKALLIGFATLAGSVWILAALNQRVSLVLGGLFGLAMIVFLFFHPRIALLMFVFLVPTRFWWTDDLHLLPSALRFADDAVLIVLGLRVVCDRLRTGRLITRTPWDIPFFIYFGVGLVSTIVNQVPIINAVAGIRAPVFYALTLLVVANGCEHFDREYLDWIWKLMLVFCALQILGGIYQYPHRGFGADSLTGTMGPNGPNDLGMFLVPALFYLLSLRVDSGDKRLTVISGIGVYALTMILCGSRASWFISLAAMLVLWGGRLRRVRALITTAVALGVVAFIATRVILLQGVSRISAAIGLSGIYAALFLPSSGGGNLAYFPIVWHLVTKHAPVPLLGLGPGMVSSGAAAHLNAPIYRNILYDYFGQTMFHLDGNVESQILSTGGEFGPIGLLAMLSVFVIWCVIALRAHRRSTDPGERAMGAAVLAAAAGALMPIPIRNVWEIPHLAFSLWLPGSILYMMYQRSGASWIQNGGAPAMPAIRIPPPEDGNGQASSLASDNSRHSCVARKGKGP